MIKFTVVLFVIFLLVPLNSFGQYNDEIPIWIKNNAKWWSDGQIDDKNFIQGIQFLINQGIIQVSSTKQISSDIDIPSWIKNNAKWWSDGQIDDTTYVLGIQYLISHGMINVSINEKLICPDMCLEGIIEKISDGDTLYIDGKKIRLPLTNTPERNEAGYFDAMEFTKKLCPVGSIASVDQDDKRPYDAFDRLLGKVYCGGKSLDSELLYNGYANIMTQYCSTSEFSSEPWAQEYGCATENNCDPSYPDVCIPSSPPDLDCRDVDFKNFRVLPPDSHRFDVDKNGIGCET